MDVDFSQVGQNVAVQSPRQEFVRQSAVEEQALKEQNNRPSRAESGQDSLRQADNYAVTNNVGSIETAVAQISDFVQARNRQLAFSIDEESQRSVVKVTDSESGEVIRQIPSEEVLALSERIKELQSDVGAAVGVLFNKQA